MSNSKIDTVASSKLYANDPKSKTSSYLHNNSNLSQKTITKLAMTSSNLTYSLLPWSSWNLSLLTNLNSITVKIKLNSKWTESPLIYPAWEKYTVKPSSIYSNVAYTHKRPTDAASNRLLTNSISFANP